LARTEKMGQGFGGEEKTPAIIKKVRALTLFSLQKSSESKWAELEEWHVLLKASGGGGGSRRGGIKSLGEETEARMNNGVHAKAQKGLEDPQREGKKGSGVLWRGLSGGPLGVDGAEDRRFGKFVNR